MYLTRDAAAAAADADAAAVAVAATAAAPGGNPAAPAPAAAPSLGHLLVTRYRGLLAGAAAGLGLAFAPPDHETRKTIALFLFARAAEVTARIGVSAGRLPAIPGADCLLLSLGSAQVILHLLLPTPPTTNR